MPEELKDKLQQARITVGLSQSKMAARLGVSVRNLQGWEQGRRTPRGLALEALNAKIDALLKG